MAEATKLLQVITEGNGTAVFVCLTPTGKRARYKFAFLSEQVADELRRFAESNKATATTKKKTAKK